MALTGVLAKHNVANKLYKSSLLNTVCLVAGVSIFFFGYDQGLMGGVNTARDYAETMGFGHWDEEQQSVVVDKPLLQGGIVSTNMQPMSLDSNNPLTDPRMIGCRLLPPRYALRLSPWWLAWRSLWPYQNYWLCLSLERFHCGVAVRRAEQRMDVLW